jgi:hypothetical protein
MVDGMETKPQSKKKRLYAVITGDIVGYSGFSITGREALLDHAKSLFGRTSIFWPEAFASGFEIYRGDSFQAVLSTPALALKTAIFVRAGLRAGVHENHSLISCDARVSIGVGTVDFMPEHRGAEGDGDAFRRSGLLLDAMKGERRLLIKTPAAEVDEELNTEFGFLDFLISKWTREQAEAVMHRVIDGSHRDVAGALNISPSAVTQRLKGAGIGAISALLVRYERLMLDEVSKLNSRRIKVMA